MSKSIGNVIEPVEVINKHGIDAFRYYFLRHIDTFADSDFTWEKFENAYNNELANDLGNLVQRLATLASKNNIALDDYTLVLPEEYRALMDNFEFSKAFDYAWEKVQGINRRIDEEKPWSLAKEGKTEELNACMNSLINALLNANLMLTPFLPNACEKISAAFDKTVTIPTEPLFPKNK
jgi:methionyl-tRNA synthetase